ncbi:MAG: NAD(P)H-dependent oxidoreductase [Chroococcidiopsidaceae cyanobacterium CP_BM_ER_R8_30]|nr:NAD(P)H-dependent oxidoreductase [Chroococcidiopsidaceae cyanobacterium CP_BM_ER_R8_30]
MISNLFVPVILGTVRQGRMSEPVAKFVLEQVKNYKGLDTELIDIRDIPITTQDAGTNAKDSVFSERIKWADALIIVTPEYNHGYPGMLKHVLDSNYEEYLHKAVGFCSVSAGSFAGSRVVEALLPVVRAYGMCPIQADMNFGEVNKLFDASGKFIDEATYIRRFSRFITELTWMAKTLKYGRENMATK